MNYKNFLIVLIIFFNAFGIYGQEENNNSDFLVTINTDYGKIKIILFDDTPLHKDNFLKLADAGVYDHTIFHRIINHFMIQSGDYTTRNQAIDYDPGLIQSPINAEILPHHLHVQGAVGAARRGDDVNPEKKSNSTQFYIIQNHNGAHHLDGKYTVFGQVMSGFEVVDLIASQATSDRDRPLKDIRINVDIDQVSRLDIEKFYNFTYK
jgi:cyclophilin family peptidyl-prolyl cis-trans isomerase